MQATQDSEIPVGEAVEYLPAWYVSAMQDHDDHPLRDASLEMLGRVMLFALAVAAAALSAVLWWLV